MRTDPFIDAKELKQFVNFSERHIIRPATQRRLGIAGARDHSCSRPVRWHRQRAAEGMRRKKFNVHFDEEED